MIQKQLEKGLLYITEDVFSIIASWVVDEVEGVSHTVSDLKDIVRVRGSKKGITVENRDDDELILEMKVAVYYGVRIPEVCKQLQYKVRKEIKLMTGLDIDEVNITVEQLTTAKE